MNCAYCRLLLEDRLDGLLDAEREAAVARHLDACPDCAREWAGLERLEDLLRQSARRPASPPARETLRRLLPFSPAPPAFPLRWIAAAAVLLVVLTFCANLGDDTVSFKDRYTKSETAANRLKEEADRRIAETQMAMKAVEDREEARAREEARLLEEARRQAEAVRVAEDAQRREQRLQEEARRRAEWTPRLRACAEAQGQARITLLAGLRGQRAWWEETYLGVLRDAPAGLSPGWIGLAADVELNSARPPLRRLLTQPQHRAAAWRTLARMKDPAALNAALAALRAGKDRDQALATLAELSPEAAIPLLFAETRVDARREPALRLLRDLGERVDPELAARLGGRDRKAQREALDLCVALHRISLTRPIRILGANAALRDDAVGALLALRDPESIPFLLEAMGEPALADQIAAGLPAFGEPGKVRMRELLAVGGTDVRARAADLLARAGDKAALPGLCALLPDARLRRDALLALGRLGERAAISSLAAYVDDPQYADLAIDAIATLGGDAALAPILRAAERRATRPRALAALGRLRALPALPLLIAALGDPRTAGVAAHSLAQLGDRKAVPALIAVLTRADAAGEALAALRSLTAQNLPADPAAWIGWWRIQGKGSSLPPAEAEVKSG